MSPILIIGALFFIFGFITWLNSVLIPYLKIACELNNLESYLVAFAFYIAYLVMAIPSGWVLNFSGYKKGMSLGLVVIAVGAIIFIPAALTRQYLVFLVGLFVQGTGLALLQTASNPYITIIGPRESAAKRISIMGICNKFAGALAPIVLGAVALSNVDHLVDAEGFTSASASAQELDALAARVVVPYIIIAAALLVLALLVYFSSLPEVDTDKEEEGVVQSATSRKSVLQFPHLLLGAITLFLYVGVEVLAGDSIISYGGSQGISLETAKFFTTATLVAMIVGYIIGIICIPKYLSQEKALLYSGGLGTILSFVVIFTDGYVSVSALALLGLANALVWPAIWPMALNGLGRFTKAGSSLLIMGIAGGALIPLLYGQLADMFSARDAYWILVPCYLFILYYALSGHKAGSPNSTPKR
ncbi:glucose/galactose transporter [Flammeovirgaceae bacterium 311]|nr:glucose/galactose transporter [Flammeovirgaceae bacterium 311]